MTRPAKLPRRLHRQAALVLAAFVATVCLTLLAPFVHAGSFAVVCSAQGNKVVALDAGGRTVDEHGAHCPLCMPVGAPPPTVIVWNAATDQPLAHVQHSIPAARLASLVGAPLPARGPPHLS